MYCVAVRCSALQCDDSYQHNARAAAQRTYCCVLQCRAVRCKVLQCDVLCCSALQCIAVRWLIPVRRTCGGAAHALLCVAVPRSALQSVAVRCIVLQCVAAHCSAMTHTNTTHVRRRSARISVCCSAAQCVAKCCSAMYCVAVHCSALQCEDSYQHNARAKAQRTCRTKALYHTISQKSALHSFHTLHFVASWPLKISTRTQVCRTIS